MNKSKVLVVEISGKRPGSKKQRPTEKYNITYDKCIISNNSNGYETEWDIINVPSDYVEYYKNNFATSDNAWYAPMNRSYAIKYAKEKGYKYLIQLDDNIYSIKILAKLNNKILYIKNDINLIDDFIDMLITVLENTNAGMAGFDLNSMSTPNNQMLSERYCYSFFALNLDVVPNEFQGDFEDDIEFRLKLKQMNIPVVQICPFKYTKLGQNDNKDLTGCRAEYKAKGVLRGNNMSKLYGDIYSCGFAKGSKAGRSGATGERSKRILFKHKIKRFKVGVIVKNKENIENKFFEIIKKWKHEK